MNTNDTTHETMTTDEALENLRSGALLAEALNGVRHGVRLLKAFEHGEAVLAALAAAFQAEKDAKARTAAVISEAEQAGVLIDAAKGEAARIVDAAKAEAEVVNRDVQTQAVAMRARQVQLDELVSKVGIEQGKLDGLLARKAVRLEQLRVHLDD